MQILPAFSGITFIFVVLLATPLLTACDKLTFWNEDSAAKPVKKTTPKSSVKKETKERIDADTYLLNLALAHLTLSRDAADISSAQPYLDVIQAYHAQPPEAGSRQTALIVQYADKQKKGIQQLVIPFSREGDPAGCSTMEAIVQHLQTPQHALHDMRPYVIATGPRPFVVDNTTAAALRVSLATEQQRMMDRAAKPPPVEEVQALMGLTRCFIQKRIRDAAYLAMENAKQSLAAISEHAAATPDDIRRLAREQAMLEETLHAVMPYTF